MCRPQTECRAKRSKVKEMGKVKDNASNQDWLATVHKIMTYFKKSTLSLTLNPVPQPTTQNSIHLAHHPVNGYSHYLVNRETETHRRGSMIKLQSWDYSLMYFSLICWVSCCVRHCVNFLIYSFHLIFKTALWVRYYMEIDRFPFNRWTAETQRWWETCVSSPSHHPDTSPPPRAMCSPPHQISRRKEYWGQWSGEPLLWVSGEARLLHNPWNSQLWTAPLSTAEASFIYACPAACQNYCNG